MPPKRIMTLEQAMDDINAWIDRNNDPNDDDEDDLAELNGELDDENIDDDENDPLENEIDPLEDEVDDETEVEDEIPEVQRVRKPLTRKRKVNSIDAALNTDNYVELPYLNCEGEWEDLTGYLGPKKNPATPKIIWTNEEPSRAGRQRACDVITSTVKELQPGIEIVSEVDAFDIFIDRNMIEHVVTKTNSYIREVVDKVRNSRGYKNSPDKYTWIRETDPLELRAYFGLSYVRGLLGQNLHHVEELFTEHSHFAFGATMSKNRFKFLQSHIVFSTAAETRDNWESDRYAAFRPFWELFNANLSKPLTPSEYMSIDETLYPMRHQIAFRQFNPKKPHKYGMLFKSINDARFPFTYKSVPYAGKPSAGTGPYYLESTIDYVKYLVQETEKDLDLKGRCISTDRLYTSIEQAQWLYDRKITNLGTMDVKRIGIPAELKDPKYENREVHSATCHFEKDHKQLCINTYNVSTKSTGRKNVVMLTTLRPLNGKTSDDGKDKPAIYKLYDFTKGGTDIVDQLNDFYTTRTKALRWTNIGLSYVLDTTRVNSKTLYCISKNEEINKKNSSFKFGWALALQLLKPYVQQRSLNGLTKMIQLKRRILLGEPIQQPARTVEPRDEPLGKRKRCDIHVEEAQTRKEKENAPKSGKQCDECDKVICSVHSVQICTRCIDNSLCMACKGQL